MKKIAIVAASAVLALTLAGCNKAGGSSSGSSSAKKGGSSKKALEAAANGDYSKLKVEKDPATKKAYAMGFV